jgi:hypothetical protein
VTELNWQSFSHNEFVYLGAKPKTEALGKSSLMLPVDMLDQVPA